MIGHDIAAALPELREHAHSLMIDSCRIDRKRLDENGDPVREMDPVTLEYADVWDEVHAGKCRVQRFRGQGLADVVVGGYEFGKTSLMIQLPVSVVGIRRQDRVTVTNLDPLSDPALAGVVAAVQDDLTKTHAVKRTLMCEEVSA